MISIWRSKSDDQRVNQAVMCATKTLRTFRSALFSMKLGREEMGRDDLNVGTVCRSIREVTSDLGGNTQQFFRGVVNSCDKYELCYTSTGSLCSSKLTQKQIFDLSSPNRASETKAFKYGAIQSRCKGQFTANSSLKLRTLCKQPTKQSHSLSNGFCRACSSMFVDIGLIN